MFVSVVLSILTSALSPFVLTRASFSKLFTAIYKMLRKIAGPDSTTNTTLHRGMRHGVWDGHGAFEMCEKRRGARVRGRLARRRRGAVNRASDDRSCSHMGPHVFTH